jgi:putative nucleotidyltransferase with HDIG domain
MKADIRKSLAEVNMELWLVFTLFVIAAVLNYAVSSNRVVLGFYTLPTLFAAYNYGRRHAVLTALASVLLVSLLALYNAQMFSSQTVQWGVLQKWMDIVAWGGILVVTAYAMGTLYDRKQRHFLELRRAYHGVLMILCHFISKDKYTQNHSYRVSVYATKIAVELGLDEERLEDVRAAALLHDIGKLEVSRDLLHKAANLTTSEYFEVSRHVDRGVELLEPVGGSLSRILPIILAHHDKFDGSGPHSLSGDDIPLEARIITLADVYDALTSDRPYRKAMSPFEAKDTISRGAGADFDPTVVEAFLSTFRKNEMEVPEVLV